MRLFFAALALIVGTVPASGQWLERPWAGIPRTANGKPNLAAPAPRAPDGKPDLSGIWEGWGTGPQGRFFDLAAGLPPGDVQMTPWAAAIAAQRAKRDHVDDPLGFCMPPGMPRIDFVDQFKIVQTPEFGVLLRQQNMDLDLLGPDAYRAVLAADLAKWSKLVRESGAKVD